MLAILALAVFLWGTELPFMAVTGLLSVILLTVVRGVPTIGEALYGFSHPVAYFFIGVLTMGLAVMMAGDSVLYYSAQTPSAIVVFEQGHLTASEILRFGLIMAAVAYS